MNHRIPKSILAQKNICTLCCILLFTLYVQAYFLNKDPLFHEFSFCKVVVEGLLHNYIHISPKKPRDDRESSYHYSECRCVMENVTVALELLTLNLIIYF